MGYDRTWTDGTCRLSAQNSRFSPKFPVDRSVPRTKSGKLVELAVRNVVQGQPVKNLEALGNPEALAFFRDRVELRC